MVASLRTRVRALLGVRRDLLSVLALAGRPLTRAEWAQFAARARIRVDPRRHMNATSLRAELRPCLEAGLLEEQAGPGGAHYRIASEVALELLRDADARYRLDDLAEGVRQQLRVARESTFGAERRLAEIGLELWVALSRRDADASRRLSHELCGQPFEGTSGVGAWLAARLGTDPTRDIIALLHPEARERHAAYALRRALLRLDPIGDALLEVGAASADAELRLDAARVHCLRGEFERATTMVTSPKAAAAQAQLAAATLGGDFALARGVAKQALKSVSRRKFKQLSGLEGVLLQFARLAGAESGDGDWEGLGRDCEQATEARVAHANAYAPLLALYRTASQGRPPELPPLDTDDWLSVLSYACCRRWLGLESDSPTLEQALGRWLETSVDGGYQAVARELGALKATGSESARSILLRAYTPKPPWEVALETLESLASLPGGDADPASKNGGQTLIFRVFEDSAELRIEARLRRRPTSKGKPASVTRLLEGAGPELSDQDRRALGLMERAQRARRRRSTEGPTHALTALADHPRVVNEEGEPLVVRKREPELRSRHEEGDVVLELFPPELAEHAFTYVFESPRELWFYERSETLERVARALPDGGLRVPGSETKRLGALVGRLGRHVALGSQSHSLEVEATADADATVAVELDWDGQRLTMRPTVFPLGPEAGSARPGEGGASFVGPVAGTLTRCERDLSAERRGLNALMQGCPTVAHLPRRDGSFRAESVEGALDCLRELHAARPEVRLMWPKERRLSSTRDLGSEALKVAVRAGGAWLEVDAQLELDEGALLSFRELLSRRRGRYVELGEDRFVRLTDDLGKRLDALESVGTLDGESLRASAASLVRLDELMGEDELTLDETVGTRLTALRRAHEASPEVPRAFDATLRDYQLEGFRFMARLADAGLGACLADDMGLGKTVQTLALLVRRAKLGPSLVVAPTSVVRNWASEANRFAPTLVVDDLGRGDRARMLAELGPRHLLLASYGLLVTEAEALASVPFATLVFDEAHALKNAHTQRAKAAHGLNADVRISLSGTPIENHLGELWSVMEATTPGLLGSERRFAERFSQPIELGDRERASQLRTLLRPFILRRTKAQVLDELPERTEVTLEVTPTEQERAFYEALRLNALEAFGAKGPKQKKRMQIFAELMRLRRAAVDPRLVDPELGPPGAKIEALVERLSALKEEGHRALVFSQFLGSLERVARRLDEEGIAHLGLDGSTSAAERERRIEAFQDGDADVFLMSLKAGGVGVNLTGADYVIHLDPWWNPAVEEQATGRAHRMGQRRPVTVYRFVTEGSIEERILALHQRKRALADDVLAGLDTSRRLDLDELRELIG